MSHNLELPDPLFDALTQAAMASGTTPVGWIAAHLPQPPLAATRSNGKTLAERFAGRTGRIASVGEGRLSESTGDRFADDLQQKRREGRL